MFEIVRNYLGIFIKIMNSQKSKNRAFYLNVFWSVLSSLMIAKNFFHTLDIYVASHLENEIEFIIDFQFWHFSDKKFPNL